MLLFLYDFTWSLILLISIPLLSSAAGRRLLKRLVPHFPGVAPKKNTVWIHALSVGEVISAQPLIKAIKKEYPARSIALTVKTAQGMIVAREKLAKDVDLVLQMPFDFWWSIRRLVRFLKPSILILVESDIWPGLILYLKKRGIRTILVNGRVSPRTYSSYRRHAFIVRHLFSFVEQCLMQTDLDSGRLIAIGIPKGKVRSIGNIKFDRPWKPLDEKERDFWINLLSLSRRNKVWVAGSTHAGEEAIIINAHKRLIKTFPDLRLIIAPRRLERVDEILGICGSEEIDATRRSELNGKEADPSKIVILDTIGELAQIYGLADVSFVGGSMVPVGGHNLLEPACFGCPVLFGEYTHNFVQMAQLLVKSGGGLIVRNEDDLYSRVFELLSDTEIMKKMGNRAKEFVQKNEGALDRVMDCLGGYIEAT